MKRPAIFFDRDNTLIISEGYLGDAEKVVLMDGAPEAIAKARSLGFVTVTISNQSGVARGMFGEEAVLAVNHKIDQMLKAAISTAIIDRHEFCPFHPEATVEQYRQESELRKPKPGMILAAAEKLALDLSRSWVIGDAPRDVQAGQAAGCRTILLQQAGLKASAAANEELASPADYVAANLKEAMTFVEKNLHSSLPANERPSAPPTRAEPPVATRLEQMVEQILFELRKRTHETDYTDFSVSKLLAGIVQVLTLALLFLAYLNHNDGSFQAYMFSAIFMQTFTIALLIMGKQK